jgi:hypothetical protein
MGDHSGRMERPKASVIQSCVKSASMSDRAILAVTALRSGSRKFRIGSRAVVSVRIQRDEVVE